MTIPKYDRHDGIEEYLDQGIAGLHALCAARSDHADAKRPHRLGDWYVLGAFRLDTLGQIWHLRSRVLAAPRVCSADAIIQVAREAVTLSMSFGSLPPPVEVCAWCRRGWALHDVHDSLGRRDENGAVTYRHVACADLETGSKIEVDLRRYIDATIDATMPFASVEIRRIPNLYPDQNGPWFLVGDDAMAIVVGWRRRVIVIDWSRGLLKAAIDGHRMFADVEKERVTVGKDFVHAWDYDKAAEYLGRLLRVCK